MDDSILRGFCQKCERTIIFTDKPYYQFVPDKIEIEHGQGSHNIEPVWFLNAKQIVKVYDSIEYEDWCERKLAAMKNPKNIADFLSMEPFLVAKILKENDKK